MPEHAAGEPVAEIVETLMHDRALVGDAITIRVVEADDLLFLYSARSFHVSGIRFLIQAPAGPRGCERQRVGEPVLVLADVDLAVVAAVGVGNIDRPFVIERDAHAAAGHADLCELRRAQREVASDGLVFHGGIALGFLWEKCDGKAHNH